MDHLVHRLRRKKTGHWDRQRQAKTSEEQDVKGDRERERRERERKGGREGSHTSKCEYGTEGVAVRGKQRGGGRSQVRLVCGMLLALFGAITVLG